MRVLTVGGSSSLAWTLIPALSSFAGIVTASRRGCDITLGLSDPAQKAKPPIGIDTTINLAAQFGGKSFGEFLETEDVDAVGALKWREAASRAGVRYMVQVSSVFSQLTPTPPFYSTHSPSKLHAEDVARLYSETVSSDDDLFNRIGYFPQVSLELGIERKAAARRKTQ